MQAGSVDEKLLADGPERTLYDRLEEVRQTAKQHMAAGRYDNALHVLCALKDPVDRFFIFPNLLRLRFHQKTRSTGHPQMLISEV